MMGGETVRKREESRGGGKQDFNGVGSEES